MTKKFVSPIPVKPEDIVLKVVKCSPTSDFRIAGFRDIFYKDELYGRAEMISHGPRGNHFEFRQVGRGQIYEGDNKRSVGSFRSNPVKVDSLAEVPAMAAKLITEGRLIPLSAIKADAARRRAETDEQEKKNRAIERVEKASPDLLSELQNLISLEQRDGVTDEEWEAAWASAEAIVAKATGG